MNTRKHPRTLQEAFGPYTSHEIEEREQPMDWQDKLVVGASVFTAVAIVVILFVWGPV